MADRQGVLAGRTGKGTRSWYADDGGDWKEIPGLDNFSVVANEPTATTISAFEGSFAEVGTAEVGDASWDIISFTPHHPAWKFMESNRVSQDNVQFRVETAEQTKFTPSSTATVAIAENGTVTFGGTGLGSASTGLTDVARGMCIRIGTDLHTIVSVTDDTVPMVIVEPVDTAVSASAYRVVFPILRWSFSGIVKSPFEMNITREAPLSSRFVVTPTRTIALPSIETSLTE